MDSQIRDRRGVAIRRDGRGDRWAKEHRNNLGKEWYMRDADEIHRCSWEIDRRENNHFVEMVFDSVRNKGKLIRSCGTLLRCERKASVQLAEDEIKNGSVCIAHLLQECRNDRAMQNGLGGRAFLVCGESYPFTYIELDPETGNELRRVVVASAADWITVYRQLGLEREKIALEQFCLKSSAARSA